MEKEEILKKLEENNINFLKLGEVTFIKSQNILYLTFLYSEENYNIMRENKIKIERLCKEFVGIQNLNYNIKFIKAFLKILF